MYINNITEHLDLLQKLQEQYGYFSFDDIDEMIDTFGDNFEVILDCYHRNRYIITLRELNELEYEDEELYEDIRSAFLHSEDLQAIVNEKNEIY